MHIYEVEGAGCAVREEVLEVGEARLAATVSYGGRAELHGAFVGLHVFLVDGCGLLGGEVGLASIVGFVRSVTLDISNF